MATEFLPPTHPLDLRHYTVPEMCNAALLRTIDSLSFRQRDTLYRDTTSLNPWRPLPAGADIVARPCLAHFSVATLPPFMRGSALQVATALSADSLVRALVALRLAAVPGAPVANRADTLYHIIRDLPGAVWGYGNSPKLHWTPGHFQMEVEALNQLRTLGLPALQDYLWSRAILLDSAIYDEDIDGEIAYWRDQRQYEQHIPLDSVADPRLRTALQESQQRAPVALDDARYRKSASRADLAVLLKDYQADAAAGQPDSYDHLLGTQAAPLTADYWFNPAAPGHPPVFPASGTLTLVVFVPNNCHNVIQQCDASLVSFNAGSQLRALHQTFPKVQIILIVQTSGWFRTMDFAGHPAQEAAMLHQYYADSLGFPGVLGVVTTPFEKEPGPDGHVVPLPVAPYTAYPNESSVLVDPIGTIVYSGLNGWYPFSHDEFLRAWFATSLASPDGHPVMQQTRGAY